MKKYKSLFKESEQKASYDLVANLYKKGSKWRTIEWANNNDKAIISNLSPTLLKKGENCNIEMMKGSSQFNLIISWKNSSNVILGCSLSFDNEKEAQKEGWSI
jgi:hypothetical protein